MITVKQVLENYNIVTEKASNDTKNLAALVPTDRIVMHPWSREVKPDIQATIQIQELHVDADGNARMVAMWSLKPAKGETISRRFACAIL